MTPETKARQMIDRKLETAGWVIQDMKELNLAGWAERGAVKKPRECEARETA